MYIEKQHFLNPPLRWLQAGCFGIGLVQLMAFAAAETGKIQLPFDYTLHVLLLLLMVFVCAGLWQAGLVFRISTPGISIRFSPFQVHFVAVKWSEVRRIRMLPAGDLPAGGRFGMPGHDFTRNFWLTLPTRRILSIELINGAQLFVSTENPEALMDYLQHGVLAMGKYELTA